LQQVLVNLLSNAIKFSKFQDTVTVKIKDKHINLETKLIDLEILVRDKGIGMTSEDLVNLGKIFFCSKDANNLEKNKNGHGLGFHIS